jgi:putative tellurite resistance protein
MTETLNNTLELNVEKNTQENEAQTFNPTEGLEVFSESKKEEIEKQYQQEQELLKPEPIPDNTEELTQKVSSAIVLTDTELSRVEQIGSQIKFDRDFVDGFASDVSKKQKKTSKEILAQSRPNQYGDIGKDLIKLSTGLKNTTMANPTGFQKLFARFKSELSTLKARYSTAEKIINEVYGKLENDQLTLGANVNRLEKMERENEELFRELVIYVEAGKRAIEHAKNVLLPEMKEKLDRKEISDNEYTRFVDNLKDFELQLYDRNSQISLCQLDAINIRTLTRTTRALYQKINRCRDILIPAWETTMGTAFIANSTQQIAESTEKVDNSINDMIIAASNASREANKAGMKIARKESLPIETLEKLTQNIIGTLDDVIAIDTETSTRIANNNVRIDELRQEVSNKLISTQEAIKKNYA